MLFQPQHKMRHWNVHTTFITEFGGKRQPKPLLAFTHSLSLSPSFSRFSSYRSSKMYTNTYFCIRVFECERIHSTYSILLFVVCDGLCVCILIQYVRTLNEIMFSVTFCPENIRWSKNLSNIWSSKTEIRMEWFLLEKRSSNVWKCMDNQKKQMKLTVW